MAELERQRHLIEVNEVGI